MTEMRRKPDRWPTPRQAARAGAWKARRERSLEAKKADDRHRERREPDGKLPAGAPAAEPDGGAGTGVGARAGTSHPLSKDSPERSRCSAAASRWLGLRWPR